MTKSVTVEVDGVTRPGKGLDSWPSDRVICTVGTWSALGTATALVLGALVYAFEGRWPGMAAYAEQFTGTKLIVWAVFAIIAVLFVSTVVAVHASTPEAQKLFGSAGFGFSLMYATICVSTCVLQFTYVRYLIDEGDLAQLEPWVSASTNSATFALDNLGFFLQGIATLWLAPLFGGALITRVIRWLFVANGVACTGLILLATFMGFQSSLGNAIYLASTLAWAAVLGTAMILLAIVFHRQLPFHGAPTPALTTAA